jgi:hypothetical protein
MGFDKINQVLTFGLCPSCISQNSGPFASGFAVHGLRIGRAEDHDAEWLRLHLRRVGPKAKGRFRASLASAPDLVR